MERGIAWEKRRQTFKDMLQKPAFFGMQTLCRMTTLSPRFFVIGGVGFSIDLPIYRRRSDLHRLRKSGYIQL